MALALDHVGISVSDLDQSLAWYEEYLDAVGVRDVFKPLNADVRVAFVSLGNRGLELMEPRSGARRLTTRGNDVGAAHIAIHTYDALAAHERLERNGVRSTTEPSELMPGVVSFYCQDPDGFRIQFIELPGANGDRHGLRFANGFHHVAFTVSDLESSLGWYREALGLSAGTRTTGSGELVSRMFEVAGSAYDVGLTPIGDTFLELMQWTSPRGSCTRFELLDAGAWHLGIAVDDLDAMHERTLAAGIDVVVPLTWLDSGSGSKRGVFVIQDLDGLYVQLQQDLSE